MIYSKNEFLKKYLVGLCGGQTVWELTSETKCIFFSTAAHILITVNIYSALRP